MSRKLVVEKYNNDIIIFQFKNGRPDEINYCTDDSVVGNIYVGYVKDVVKNIDAAFVEFGDEIGYFSTKNNIPIYLNEKKNKRICSGDKILVQVSKDRIKSKEYTVTSNIEIPGELTVLTVGIPGIKFSSKINDESFKNEIKDLINSDSELGGAVSSKEVGFIIRTNAYGKSSDKILSEMREQLQLWRTIKGKALHKMPRDLVFKKEHKFIQVLKNTYIDELEEIVIEDEDIFKTVTDEFSVLSELLLKKVRKYDDEMLPMHKLYSLEKILHNAGSKNVWLKSGAYIVIEPTEAFVSIDVNTGKCDKKSDAQKTFLNINLEAAEEIARQIKIRNLSGIIIVDFINMKDDDNNEKLIEKMRELLSHDRVTSKVAGMTNLGLIEITRKKVNKPLYEYMNYQK